MIETILTDEQKSFRQTLREFGKREIEPRLKEYADKKMAQRVIMRCKSMAAMDT